MEIEVIIILVDFWACDLLENTGRHRVTISVQCRISGACGPLASLGSAHAINQSAFVVKVFSKTVIVICLKRIENQSASDELGKGKFHDSPYSHITRKKQIKKSNIIWTIHPSY
jgi:hypothetical protein